MGTSSRWMLVVLAACGGIDRAEYIARDPCAPLALTAATATPAELDGIAGAIALWRDRGVSAFDAAPAEAPAIEIGFDDAAPAFHGAYDPDHARVLINRDIADAATLGVVIAHELGHVFGLVHVAPAARMSVMNPGNLITPPTDDDQRAMQALWGSCR
ncbi:MAG: matrixin family metalloprotease [Deltaproteobacteria bacterium]|nr:MAG: matrixin family metalloprotease [Deltaproteobacteria bacterium]